MVPPSSACSWWLCSSLPSPMVVRSVSVRCVRYEACVRDGARVNEQIGCGVPYRTEGEKVSGDRRVRRTRRLVQQALVELILEKGYDAVTVTDIIDRADVGRSTFYAHFTDKQDVLFSNLDELAF